MDSNIEENVSVLAIVGIGGLGKTTLAKHIFNDEKIQESFEVKMWVCVSENFEVQKIVEVMLKLAKKKKPKTPVMETLVADLKNEIGGKKYFLVLDDLWNEESEKWRSLKTLLVGGARGSRILVTTRSEKVAKISKIAQAAAAKQYSLRGLDEDASWCLFKQMAFDKGADQLENSRIVAIGKEILEKCVGVPLAIRTIGRLLNLRNSETEWLSFKTNELQSVKQNDILPILKLSYDKLPPHLKPCFAYCSLFPKDSLIRKSILVKLWVAQGYIHLSDQNQCFEEVGNEYFRDLLWRSFFQEAKLDEYGDVISCKMHDLMHDLANNINDGATFDPFISSTVIFEGRDVPDVDFHSNISPSRSRFIHAQCQMEASATDDDDVCGSTTLPLNSNPLLIESLFYILLRTYNPSQRKGCGTSLASSICQYGVAIACNLSPEGYNTSLHFKNWIFLFAMISI